MYKVELSKDADKQFAKLDTRYKQAAVNALRRLSENPIAGKPLHGDLKGYWKLRFSRYRIIYKIFQNILLIVVITIEHRKDVYRN